MCPWDKRQNIDLTCCNVWKKNPLFGFYKEICSGTMHAIKTHQCRLRCNPKIHEIEEVAWEGDVLFNKMGNVSIK